mmetsp:Transcript_22094/g.52205  ORF Transcript_22094/g.52205 Transcript_22094/m.52205 type:complete len:215 (+) Transcript_22094:1368-2012(+)
MKELASRALHAQVPQPVAAHDRPQPRVVLGGGHGRHGVVARGEDRARLAIREGVEGVRYALREGVILEVVLDHRRRHGRRLQDGLAELNHLCCSVKQCRKGSRPPSGVEVSTYKFAAVISSRSGFGVASQVQLSASRKPGDEFELSILHIQIFVVRLLLVPSFRRFRSERDTSNPANLSQLQQNDRRPKQSSGALRMLAFPGYVRVPWVPGRRR